MPGTPNITPAHDMSGGRAPWVWAVSGALLLNLAMFGLIPKLLDRVPDTTQYGDVYEMDAFIRVKRLEKPVNRKEKPKKPEIRKKIPKKKLLKSIQPKRQKIKPLRSLPFQLNNKLPVPALTTLHVPMSLANVGAPALDGVYDVGDIDNPLTTLVRVPPVYPLRAQRRGIEGWVKVRFLVNEDGTVENVTVVSAKPENIFEKNVIQCVSSWRFKPGTVEGVAVKTLAETTVRFNLD